MSAGRAGFRIASDWRRPEEDVVARLASAGSAVVSDAMSRMGALDGAIKPLWADCRLSGPAMTVRCPPADNLMVHKAVDLAQAGDVLVIATQGNRTHAVFGELLGRAAAYRRVAGVVVDGVVRDLQLLRELGLPVFARGVAPGSCDKYGPGEIGFPVACGYAVVQSGDFVIGDGDGLAVVPRDTVDAVALKTVEIRDRETRRRAEIASGMVLKEDVRALLLASGVSDG